jgi:hypothetical protein
MKTVLALVSLALLGIQTTGYSQAPTNEPPAPPPQSAGGAVPLARLAEKIKAANDSYRAPVSDVVKMAEAGVDEKAVLSYIDNSPGFRLNADDIIYLHEKGVSTTVITALLQHGPRMQVAQAAPATVQFQQPAQVQPQQSAPVEQTYAQPAQSVYVAPPPVVYTQPSYVYNYPTYYPSYSYFASPGYCYSRPYFSFGFYGGCLPIHRFGGFRTFGGSHHFAHAGFRHH